MAKPKVCTDKDLSDHAAKVAKAKAKADAQAGPTLEAPSCCARRRPLLT